MTVLGALLVWAALTTLAYRVLLTIWADRPVSHLDLGLIGSVAVFVFLTYDAVFPAVGASAFTGWHYGMEWVCRTLVPVRVVWDPEAGRWVPVAPDGDETGGT